MGEGINPAWISAGAALLGTIVGGLLAVGKDVLLERRRLDREKVYLAVIVSSHLNEFAGQCAVIADDDGTADGVPAGDGTEHEVTTKPPTFRPLEINVNWEILPSNLLDSIFRLPYQQERIESYLAYLFNYELDPPEHAEFFWTRRRDYAELAIHASNLAKELRKESKLSIEPVIEGEVDLAQEMRRVISRIDRERESRKLRSKKHQVAT